MSESCIFCQIVEGKMKSEIIADFENCMVIMDSFPVTPGHLLIIPKTHIEGWFESDGDVYSYLFDAVKDAKKWLDAEYSPDGYNIGINIGEAAGQSIPHLHVHLIPRYSRDMEKPKGGVRGVIPKKQGY